MVYTSFFGNVKVKNLLKNNSDKVVAITRFGPKIPCSKLRMLAPSADLLNKLKSGKIDYAKFAELFLVELNELDYEEIIEKIDGKILCCYCGEDKLYCHRDIVRYWILFKSDGTIFPQEL